MNDSTQVSWLKRLSGGLKRSSSSLGDALAKLSKVELDAAAVEELEGELIRADLGPEFASHIVQELSEGRFYLGTAFDEVKAALAGEIEKVLAPVAKPLEVTAKPFVILVAGVNGSGKTTTIGKLASKFRAEGKSVMLVAGDTFRAAAIDQLKIWGERSGASVMAREPGADADEMHRQAELGGNGDENAATRGAVELGHDKAGDAGDLAENLDLVERILADGGIEHQQNRVRRRRLDLAHHAHHFF